MGITEPLNITLLYSSVISDSEFVIIFTASGILRDVSMWTTSYSRISCHKIDKNGLTGTGHWVEDPTQVFHHGIFAHDNTNFFCVHLGNATRWTFDFGFHTKLTVQSIYIDIDKFATVLILTYVIL